MRLAEIERIAEQVLRPELGDLGLERIVAREEYFDSEERVLSVDALMKAGTGVVDAAVVSDAHHVLREVLLAAGEERFPHFMIRHPYDEEPESDVPVELH